MAGFQKLDKKQVPQVIGLGVASCSLFGYFAIKMITPTASAAPPPAPAKQPTTTPASVSAAPASATAAPASATDASADGQDAPPPTAGMRDPFIPTVKIPVVAATPPAAPIQVATANVGQSGLAGVPAAGLGPLPAVSPLPGGPQAGGASPALTAAGGPAPMPVGPVAPAAPAWTVTGVLMSGSQSVAILRNGDAREFARPGDMVDATFRVVHVTPFAVVLRHGDWHYTLPLGGIKAAPAAAPAAQAAPPAVPGAAVLAPAPSDPAPAGPTPQASAPASQGPQTQATASATDEQTDGTPTQAPF